MGVSPNKFRNIPIWGKLSPFSNNTYYNIWDYHQITIISSLTAGRPINAWLDIFLQYIPRNDWNFVTIRQFIIILMSRSFICAIKTAQLIISCVGTDHWPNLPPTEICHLMQQFYRKKYNSHLIKNIFLQ